MRQKLIAMSLLLVGLCHADINIGISTGITGVVAVGAKENVEGAKIYFDAINAQGGISGQKINLIVLDDKFAVEQSVENAKTLVGSNKVVSLMLTRGTPNSQAIAKELGSLGVPFVGPSTGAMSLHQPVNRWVFNVRSTYRLEAEKAIELLAAMQMRQIGVIHAKDSFGEDVMVGVNNGMNQNKIKPMFVTAFDRAKPEYDPIVAQIVKENPQIVFAIGAAGVVSQVLARVRAQGGRSQFVTLSNNASAGFIKELDKNGPGTIVTQVYPSEFGKSPMVGEANSLAKEAKIAELSPSHMEGFAAAKVMVAALKRVRGSFTGESIRQALDGLSVAEGELRLAFNPQNHSGFSYVDLSIIGKDGKFRR
jgi:ABC-type branched-subunit amino acid transport system substrate-binding protein